MDELRRFLELIRREQLVRGNLAALWHIVIGRRIEKAEGTPVSAGVTWRQLAELLRHIRWDRELVTEIGLNPDDLPPRDRARYWYTAIAASGINTDSVRIQADRLAERLAPLGYRIGPSPLRGEES